MRPPPLPELFRPPLTYPPIPYGQMLDRPVTLYPEHEAVVFGDTSITFRELEGLVNAFANALRTLGVGPGDRVCRFMTYRPECRVSFIAVPPVGAVSRPINPANHIPHD